MTALPRRPRHATPRRRPGSPACRTSSRPTTRRPTSRGWCAEALETLPSIAETFEIIAVNDGSKDRTREIADRLAAEHPDVVRVVHHEVNRGYGGALRSGFEASRYELLAFTDGDRQFRVADLAPADGPPRPRPDHPDVVVGYRIKRADPIIRDRLRAHLQARQPDLLRPQGPGRRLRLQAVPPRGARGRPGRVRRRVLLRRAADQGPGGGPHRSPRSASRTTRGRPARRRAPSRR